MMPWPQPQPSFQQSPSANNVITSSYTVLAETSASKLRFIFEKISSNSQFHGSNPTNKSPGGSPIENQLVRHNPNFAFWSPLRPSHSKTRKPSGPKLPIFDATCKPHLTACLTESDNLDGDRQSIESKLVNRNLVKFARANECSSYPRQSKSIEAVTQKLHAIIRSSTYT